ncbi:MAG: ribonuclease [Rhodocyclaceae bacterium]|nr:ribonuclease [Rhodocyclaceae bacterium]
MKRWLAGWTALLACSAVFAFFSDSVRVDQLPKEARHTLQLIDAGGPFPYTRDGITFQNREKRLPMQPKGYYREYTVPTPGEATRGARRIVAGGQPPVVLYYTADHYRTFKKINR